MPLSRTAPDLWGPGLFRDQVPSTPRGVTPDLSPVDDRERPSPEQEAPQTALLGALGPNLPQELTGS